MIIIVDGKIGSGKTTISQKLSDKYNLHHFNCDEEVKKIYENVEVKNKILNILKIKELDFDEMAKIIFTNKVKRKKIEDLIFLELNNRVESLNEKNIVLEGYNAMKAFKNFDIILLCSASEEVREKRVLKRDNRTKENFSLINSVQKNTHLLNNPTYVINTEEDIDVQIEKVMEIYDKYRNIS